MDYELDIITRKQIPSNIFLCGENDEKDFDYIHKYQFNNGLTYIIGSNNYIESPKDFIENMEFEMKTVLEENNNPDELQQYYKDNFDIFYYYRDCEKIWNYYKNNEHLIKQIIEFYKDTDNEDNNIETDTDEEGYSSD